MNNTIKVTEQPVAWLIEGLLYCEECRESEYATPMTREDVYKSITESGPVRCYGCEKSLLLQQKIKVDAVMDENLLGLFQLLLKKMDDAQAEFEEHYNREARYAANIKLSQLNSILSVYGDVLLDSKLNRWRLCLPDKTTVITYPYGMVR